MAARPSCILRISTTWTSSRAPGRARPWAWRPCARPPRATWRASWATPGASRWTSPRRPAWASCRGASPTRRSCRSWPRRRSGRSSGSWRTIIGSRLCSRPATTSVGKAFRRLRWSASSWRSSTGWATAKRRRAPTFWSLGSGACTTQPTPEAARARPAGRTTTRTGAASPARMATAARAAWARRTSATPATTTTTTTMVTSWLPPPYW
mmetsp:Transcript_15203/g.43222  ORF Transcript_15203/g.43222 Transcript_15203/m.43222 type:complete len:209 (-) Transcript_15203:128-754(-)